MAALFKFFCSSTSQPVDSGDSGICCERGSLFKTEIFEFKVLIIETVTHKVQKVRNYCFRALFFQKFHQIIVGGGEELYKNLSYYADFRFL